MNKANYDDIVKTCNTNIRAILDILPLIVPCDKDDERLLKIGADMLKDIRNDINNPQTIGEVFDIEKLNEDWAVISESMVELYSTPVTVLMDQIVKDFTDNVVEE